MVLCAYCNITRPVIKVKEMIDKSIVANDNKVHPSRYSSYKKGDKEDIQNLRIASKNDLSMYSDAPLPSVFGNNLLLLPESQMFSSTIENDQQIP